MSRLARIRELNDAFRTTLTGGRVLVTAGVQGRGEHFVARALEAVRTFDAFTEDNDPYGEHDFGNPEVEGVKLLWKVDYYNPEMTGHSEDPADPEQTVRVLTIMLPLEY